MYRTDIRLLLLAGLLGCSAGDDVPAPLIASVTPSHGTPGTSVMIIGDYFCQDPEGEQCDNGGTVAFDSTPANVGMYSEHTIMVEVPGVTPGIVDVTVTAAGRRSNNIEFRIELP